MPSPKRSICHPGLEALRARVEHDGIATREQREAWADAVLEPIGTYPLQLAIAQAIWRGEQHQAIEGTRRAGKSQLFRVPLARALVEDGWVCVILTSVLIAPTRNILDRPHDRGLLGVLSKLGLWPGIAKVARAGRSSIVEISFPWNSGIYVLDIGDAAAIDKHHGTTANLFWIDEATRTPYLSLALKDLVYPTLSDHGARVILTYTPDDDVHSLPSRLSESEDPEWQYHHMAAWRNPHFGETFQARWHTIVKRTVAAARSDYSLSDDDLARMYALTEPECDAISRGQESAELRRWVEGDNTPQHPGLDRAILIHIFGRQVRDAGRYVYAWYRVQPEQLYWCGVAARDDVRVLATLEERISALVTDPDLQHPNPRESMDWRVVLGVDIGYWPDPWAWTAWMWSPWHDVAYEIGSGKEHKLGDAEMLDLTVEIVNRVVGAGIPVDRVVADLTGMRAGTRIDWDRAISARFPRVRQLDGATGRVRVVAPKKGPTLTRIRVFNLDLAAGRYRVIAGGDLDIEGRHLRFRTDKPGEIDKQREIRLANGAVVVPGDHCLDTALYAQQEIRTLRSQIPEMPRAPAALSEESWIGHEP